MFEQLLFSVSKYLKSCIADMHIDKLLVCPSDCVTVYLVQSSLPKLDSNTVKIYLTNSVISLLGMTQLRKTHSRRGRLHGVTPGADNQ